VGGDGQVQVDAGEVEGQLDLAALVLGDTVASSMPAWQARSASWPKAMRSPSFSACPDA
jgi:hypothetical protein